MAILVTPNVDEFCEQYCMEYDPMDDLVDTGRGCEWRDKNGVVKGFLCGGSAKDITTWVYLNLK